MKVQVSTILSALGILKALDTTAMKLSTSVLVKKVLVACEFSIQDFEAKRIALAKKHGILNDDKTKYLFETPDAQGSFENDMQEIMDDEIDIDIPAKIPLALIDDHINIAPSQVELVSWFIEGID
jgi:hypothetical protein